MEDLDKEQKNRLRSLDSKSLLICLWRKDFPTLSPPILHCETEPVNCAISYRCHLKNEFLSHSLNSGDWTHVDISRYFCRLKRDQAVSNSGEKSKSESIPDLSRRKSTPITWRRLWHSRLHDAQIKLFLYYNKLDLFTLERWMSCPFFMTFWLQNFLHFRYSGHVRFTDARVTWKISSSAANQHSWQNLASILVGIGKSMTLYTWYHRSVSQRKRKGRGSCSNSVESDKNLDTCTDFSCVEWSTEDPKHMIEPSSILHLASNTVSSTFMPYKTQLEKIFFYR